MFQSIQYLNHNYNTTNQLYDITYKIIDTDFTIDYTIAAVAAMSEAAGAAVIKCYQEKSLPVIPNLLQYYLYTQEKYGKNNDSYQVKNLLNLHKKYMDNYFQEVEFSKKYYPQLLEKYNSLKINL